MSRLDIYVNRYALLGMLIGSSIAHFLDWLSNIEFGLVLGIIVVLALIALQEEPT